MSLANEPGLDFLFKVVKRTPDGKKVIAPEGPPMDDGAVEETRKEVAKHLKPVDPNR